MARHHGVPGIQTRLACLRDAGSADDPPERGARRVGPARSLSAIEAGDAGRGSGGDRPCLVPGSECGAGATATTTSATAATRSGDGG